MHWRRKWQPTPVFLPGESQGWGSLVGCRLWGRTESDTTEAMQQQQHCSNHLFQFQMSLGIRYKMICLHVSLLLEDGNYVLFLSIPSAQHKACKIYKFDLSWMNYFCSLDLSFLACNRLIF